MHSKFAAGFYYFDRALREFRQMALRLVYAPVLPEMDSFLFASVDDEMASIPLSVLSALSRLDLDPRDEAMRLSRLTRDAASDQLARIIARLPDRHRTSLEAGRIATRLVALLPPTNKHAEHAQPSGAVGHRISPRATLSLICLALAGAVFIGLIAQGSLSSDGREAAAQPASQANPAISSNQPR